MILEWCPPPPGGAEACRPCLSVKAVRRGGGPRLFSQVDAVFGRTLLNMRPLSLEQARALQPRFPSLIQSTLGGKLRADRVEK